MNSSTFRTPSGRVHVLNLLAMLWSHRVQISIATTGSIILLIQTSFVLPFVLDFV